MQIDQYDLRARSRYAVLLPRTKRCHRHPWGTMSSASFMSRLENLTARLSQIIFLDAASHLRLTIRSPWRLCLLCRRANRGTRKIFSECSVPNDCNAAMECFSRGWPLIMAASSDGNHFLFWSSGPLGPI